MATTGVLPERSAVMAITLVRPDCPGEGGDSGGQREGGGG